MEFEHKNLAAGRWQEFSLAQQLAHIGSEVGRAARWQGKDDKLFWSAVTRASELFYLTLKGHLRHSQLKEITRIKEIFCDAVSGGKEYGTKLNDLKRYFFYFAMYCQRQKC